jgi:uncharacterized protein
MKKKIYDVAIIGAGTAGLSAAFFLAYQGDLNVVVLDQGDDYESRILSDASGNGDLLRGVGGAGTLAGGKLCGIPASLKLWQKTWYALPSFNEFLKATPLPPSAKEVLTPHELWITDKKTTTKDSLFSKNYPSALLPKKDMQTFIRSLYDRANTAGCDIKTRQTVIDLLPSQDFFALKVKERDHEHIFAKSIILATGRSSAGYISDLIYKTRAKAASLAPDLGIRFNIPYSSSDLFVNFGQDLKLKTLIGDAITRTFCVCTGGDSVLINTGATSYFDGHFTDQLTEIVNVGIVARRPNVTGYKAAQKFALFMGKMLAGKNITVQEFINHQKRLTKNNPEYDLFQQHIDVIQMFLKSLAKTGGITGNLNQYEIIGPTIDRYWPRIETNQYFETHHPGLFVVGDVAGISRGYVQSMWSAYCAAKSIIKRMNKTTATDKLIEDLFTRSGKIINIAA